MMLPEDLAGLSFFEGMSAEQLALLAPLFRCVVFPAGSEVFAEGDEASELYLLVSGRVAIRVMHYDGGQVDVNVVQPGSLWGWSAALGRPTYTASAVCLSETHALAALGCDLRYVMQTYPDLGKLLLERIAQVAANRSMGMSDQLLRMFQVDPGD
ncbi:MAG TPA: cyclic nucleotide-binding domain-containing protein [Anaerolineae bacterium]